jgi:fido (protein-threonine AMPylation protein)
VNDLPAGPARYGTTPVDPDDLGALVEGLVVTTKAGLDELEAAGLARVWQNRAERMISGQIDLEELTEPEALVELHWDALEAIWTWAGLIRSQEMNIGTAGCVNPPFSIILMIRRCRIHGFIEK